MQFCATKFAFPRRLVAVSSCAGHWIVSGPHWMFDVGCWMLDVFQTIPSQFTDFPRYPKVAAVLPNLCATILDFSARLSPRRPGGRADSGRPGLRQHRTDFDRGTP